MGIPVKVPGRSFEVVMGSFMLKDGVLNSVEHAVSFGLKPAQCVPIGCREECQCCGEWWE
jgi:hypothetical protein